VKIRQSLIIYVEQKINTEPHGIRFTVRLNFYIDKGRLLPSHVLISAAAVVAAAAAAVVVGRAVVTAAIAVTAAAE